MKRGALISVLVASSMTVMAGATISPALPKMGEHFVREPHAATLVKLALTLPALCIALGAPLAGWLLDRWQRRGVLLLSVLLYGVAGFSGFWATNLPFLLAGRIGLGFAVAGIMTATTTIISDYYSGADRNRYLSLQGTSMSFGGVVFGVWGGALAEFSWRTPFAVYLVAFAVLPALWFFLEEPPRNDVAQESDEKETEKKSDEENAGLPWGLLLSLYFVGWLSQIIFYEIPVQFPFYVQENFGKSAFAAGLAMALFNVCAATIALRYNWFKERLSFPLIFTTLFGTMSAGYLMIAQTKSYALVLLGLGVAGLGIGLLVPNLNVWLMARTPEAWRGRVVGGMTTCFFLGQFMSPIVAQPYVTSLNTSDIYALSGGVLLGLAACYGGWALVAPKQEPARSEGIENAEAHTQ